MPERIPQSVAIRIPLQAYLSSDHVSPATGKTIAITISKNGAAYANPSGGATNATEVGSGSYYVDLSTTDTGTTGPLWVKGTNADIDNVIAIYNVANAFNAGFTGVPGAAAEAAGGLYTRGSGAGQINQSNNGQIDVDAKRINGVATTSVTTVNANVGTTQPTNYTGTGASALIKSDVVDWGGAAVPALSGGLIPADMQAISTDTTAADNLESAFDGTGSVMTLTQLRVAAANANGGIYVTNTTGPGADISSSNSGSAGVKITGNGTGNGLDCTGGATGHGISGSGGGTSGRGMSLAGVGSSPGLQASGGSSGSGIIATGQGAGSGLLASGGSSGGAGISGSGGTSGSGIIGTGSGSGHGIRAVGGSSGNGLNATTTGNGNGANFVGSGSGHGLAATGGNSGGNGINATVFPSGGIGLNIAGDGTNPGMSIAGGSSATSDLILTHSLSPSLANIVWDALIASHLGAGTTGEALNNKATVASIFAQVIENSYTFLEIMRLLGSSQGGETNGGVAGGTGTFNIRDLADSKNRVASQYDANGNRITAVLDLT